MNSTYEIRTAHESDAAAIADLIYSTSLACCFSVEQPCPDWYASTLKAEPLLKLLRQEKMIWLLAEEGGTVVGVLALLDDNHVKYFFVHQDHQRRGVGKRLWAFALAARMLPPPERAFVAVCSSRLRVSWLHCHRAAAGIQGNALSDHGGTAC